jgi:lipoprotein-anchoring transpeptidase ErfK/SrfK
MKISTWIRTTAMAATLTVASVAQAQEAGLRLEVDLSDNQLSVYRGDEVVETYAVSTGKEKYPTPTGTFRVRKIVWNPSWVPPEEKWAKDKSPKPPGHPDNPMKRAKIFFKEPDYYIHGTGDIESLGAPASHGCVRMSPEEVTELARLLMEHGGKPKPLPWYRRIFKSKKTAVVVLAQPIELRITS